ncbi:hypothetical protein BpHYR1_034503 [Brachionus plicatilis]|uniref:Uncharacterized protein n=1 Tax=Brachionus plicatilis TaxID=10195 RepID=A0A3M7RQ50_BRAPC|nr:hypothetical protein BpHYR1_034503 [Brachionus plicatilis]
MESTIYKVPSESFVRNTLKKKTLQYGEQLLGKFLKIYEIFYTIEAIILEMEGVMGHVVQYSVLEWSSSGCHGTKDGAKRMADWSWWKRLFEESG